MDFLQSLIFPLKMRRFRNMSVIISIAIFFVIMYLVVIPIKVRYRNNDIPINQNQYMSKDFIDATSDFDYNQIKDNNYKIEASALSADVQDVKKFVVNSTLNNEAYTFHFVFDLTKEEYNANDDLYTNYEIDKSTSNCVILFAKSFYELQTAKESDGVLNANIIQAATYKGCTIDFGAYTTTNELLDGVGNAMAELYSSMFVSSVTITSGLMVVILPIILVLVMWLILRKNGSLKRFKEYYNIAAIVAIIPGLVAFGLAWFWPQIINFYTTVFAIYYLFVVYRINALPIDYSPEKQQKQK